MVAGNVLRGMHLLPRENNAASRDSDLPHRAIPRRRECVSAPIEVPPDKLPPPTSDAASRRATTPLATRTPGLPLGSRTRGCGLSFERRPPLLGRHFAAAGRVACRWERGKGSRHTCGKRCEGAWSKHIQPGFSGPSEVRGRCEGTEVIFGESSGLAAYFSTIRSPAHANN